MFNYLKQQLCNYDKAQDFYSVFREKINCLQRLISSLTVCININNWSLNEYI